MSAPRSGERLPERFQAGPAGRPIEAGLKSVRRRTTASPTFALTLACIIAGSPTGTPIRSRRPAAPRAADALRAGRELRSYLRAQLPGMDCRRGPDRARRGARLRQGGERSPRPAAPDPHQFPWRLGRRRHRHRRNDSREEARGRSRADADRRLPQDRPELRKAPRPGDHRRRGLRLRLPAHFRRRG